MKSFLRSSRLKQSLLVSGLIFLVTFNFFLFRFSRTRQTQLTPKPQGQVLQAATGPLRVHSTNRRYFTDDGVRAVYLTGSHSWDSLRDFRPNTFNFNQYLNWLQANNHNFIRLWVWDFARFDAGMSNFRADEVTPFPWERSGPGTANDGRPRFDFDRRNPVYFNRLRSRVQAAEQRGIYVSIMLFEGWGLSLPGDWAYHPFNIDNNVNGINGDPNGDGYGIEIHTLQLPNVTSVQETYIRWVIDSVNDLDNVLYEISNETDDESTDWQYHMINYIKSYEADEPNQHPVGMTRQLGNWSNNTLFNSPADWISPGGSEYATNPPVFQGTKVIISDSDHYAPGEVGRDWVWRSICRGLNPIMMDDFNNYFGGTFNQAIDQGDQEARLAQGYALSYAQRMDLAAMTPQNSLVSTNYCLANLGSEYFVYQPESGSFTVNLRSSTYSYEWFNPGTGNLVSTGNVTVDDGNHTFSPPFSGDAVLYIRSASIPTPTPTSTVGPGTSTPTSGVTEPTPTSTFSVEENDPIRTMVLTSSGCYQLGDGAVTLASLECVFENAIKAFLGLAAIILFVVILVAGFKYITSGGDPKAVQSAKMTLTYAIGGMVLIAISFLILQFISVFTGAPVTEFVVGD